MEILLQKINSLVWGMPTIAFILFTGIVLTFKLEIIQFFKLGSGFKLMVYKKTDNKGGISSFGALCTSLSATIGTGNIIGVATAIATGGPGALFWMEVSAFFGMAVKYTEGFLAIKYRHHINGKYQGGPHYYIEKGLGRGFYSLSNAFAFCTALAGLMGMGTITQVNSITKAVESFYYSHRAEEVLIGNISWITIITGLVVTVLTYLIVIGGIGRISKVAQIIVPTMVVVYLSMGMMIIVNNLASIPLAFMEIVGCAFNPSAFYGGAVGFTIKDALQKGISRGIFSNEAGLGTAPIAIAATSSTNPVQQGLVAMVATFIDTMIVCSITGLAIIITGAWREDLQGSEITIYAFTKALPFPPPLTQLLLMISLVFFAFTTILGWNYYGEQSVAYLSGGNKVIVKIYRHLYIIAVAVGPYLTVTAVWTLADIFNGLMAIPNLIGIVLMSGLVARESNSYLRKHRI